MTTSTVRLLRAASEIVGGLQALAQRLDINEKVLGIYMADARDLPDSVLLKAVDIILEDRAARLPAAGDVAVQYLPPKQPLA